MIYNNNRDTLKQHKSDDLKTYENLLTIKEDDIKDTLEDTTELWGNNPEDIQEIVLFNLFNNLFS